MLLNKRNAAHSWILFSGDDDNDDDDGDDNGAQLSGAQLSGAQLSGAQFAWNPALDLKGSLFRDPGSYRDLFDFLGP